jgi:hypothetical protein
MFRLSTTYNQIYCCCTVQCDRFICTTASSTHAYHVHSCQTVSIAEIIITPAAENFQVCSQNISAQNFAFRASTNSHSRVFKPEAKYTFGVDMLRFALRRIHVEKELRILGLIALKKFKIL